MDIYTRVVYIHSKLNLTSGISKIIFRLRSITLEIYIYQTVTKIAISASIVSHMQTVAHSPVKGRADGSQVL